MRVIQMIAFLFAVSGFTAAQSADENGLSRRQLAEAAREKFLTTREEYLAASDEYLVARDLDTRGNGPAPKYSTPGPRRECFPTKNGIKCL
ncbi:unnamed protein product [Clonostachys rosea]|uniref:Uncharacterized protein n=1 Tax=Bionectria ochroleuca TaxID=29856 RepID=A0ABY6UK36_BIOOC|nr:unnamed protein product [Clonostachys rosea]